ncbi:hypothetical protein T492DRAFT_521512 [Pavlovales sp. CCMP2436]|nr:hypothetical protein T492DRAFT_521512 [Pavlovales sp. CCMP2436]
MLTMSSCTRGARCSGWCALSGIWRRCSPNSPAHTLRSSASNSALRDVCASSRILRRITTSTAPTGSPSSARTARPSGRTVFEWKTRSDPRSSPYPLPPSPSPPPPAPCPPSSPQSSSWTRRAHPPEGAPPQSSARTRAEPPASRIAAALRAALPARVPPGAEMAAVSVTVTRAPSSAAARPNVLNIIKFE